MKVIGFEEHYKLPAIQEANRDNPGELVYDVWKKAGRFETDAQGGWPAGIYDLGEGDIDFPACHRILKDTAYRGWICVDLDYTRNGPRASYEHCGRYVVDRLDPIYA